MAEENVIIGNEDMDDDGDWDDWMDPVVAEKIEIERERRAMWKKLYAKEESSDKEPDFDFRTSDVEELLQYEREQLSKKNLETSVVQFIKHRELGLQKSRTLSMKKFLKSRKYWANSIRKCSESFCIDCDDAEDPNHTRVKCFGNRLCKHFEFYTIIEKLEEDYHENLLRHDLETLKSLREYMNGRREDQERPPQPDTSPP